MITGKKPLAVRILLPEDMEDEDFFWEDETEHTGGIFYFQKCHSRPDTGGHFCAPEIPYPSGILQLYCSFFFTAKEEEEIPPSTKKDSYIH